MHAFRRTRTGYVTRLDATERSIVASVVADVAALLGHPVSDLAAQGPGPDGGADQGDGFPAVDWSAAEPDGALAPSDPALARLLPSASEDGEVADEMRRMTEESVRTAKAERLRRVWWDLRGGDDEIRVPDDRAMVWAGALTDVRLVLAERLGVTDADGAAGLEDVALTSPDEVARAMASLYLALSWLQESLVEAMLTALPQE